MSGPHIDIPLVWILEYAINNPGKFKSKFLEGLMWEIAKNPDQPQIPPTLIIALLRRIISHQNDPAKVCGADMDILDTIKYLELLEHHRTKRIKALENRGGPLVVDFLRTATVAQNRYNFALVGLKLWSVYVEIARKPFNPYNAQHLITLLFPEDESSQTQSEEDTQAKSTPDAQKRIDLTTLVTHISKGLSKMPADERRNYDASKHPTLLKNQSGLPWSKVSSVLMSYLDSTKILFQRSEILINSERRIGGRRIENEMIRTMAEALQREAGF